MSFHDTSDLSTQAQHRTRRFLLAAGLTATVGVAGIGALLWWITAPGHAPGTVTRNHNTDIKSADSLFTPSVASGMANVRWVQANGMRLPISDHDGPVEMRQGRARGFSRTPAGAVLAAVNLTARVAPHVGPTVFGPTISEQVTGVDKDTFATGVAADYQRLWQKETVPTGASLPTFGQVRGYRIEAATPTSAAVHLLMTGPRPGGGSLSMDFRTELSWINNDWHLLAPPNGQWIAVATQVTDTGGYQLFDQGK
jgi:hypothetical protein